MGRGFGEVPKAILTLANGRMARQMDMECIHGLMEIDMRVSLRTV